MNLFIRTSENTAIGIPLWLYLFVIPLTLVFYMIVFTLWLLAQIGNGCLWLWEQR